MQTDLTTSDMQFMEECKARLENKTELKRDLLIEDICKDDRSVRFFTGIPSLTCLLMVFNFLQPFAEKMKYWDGKKKTASKSLSGWSKFFQGTIHYIEFIYQIIFLLYIFFYYRCP